jgi:hypothetical protein
MRTAWKARYGILFLACTFSIIVPRAADGQVIPIDPSFVNLNFEDVVFDTGTGDVLDVPGWTFWSGEPKTVSTPEDDAEVLLLTDPLAVEGQYSIGMQAGTTWVYPPGEEYPVQGPVDAPYMYQTATVPLGTQSIILNATSQDPFGLRETQYDEWGGEIPGDSDATAWQLFFGGHVILLHDLGDGRLWGRFPYQAIYGTLAVSLNEDYYVEVSDPEYGSWTYFASVIVDDIRFLPYSAVPEPASWLILAAGFAPLVGAVRRKRR